MNVIIFGPNGSGKGTQGAAVKDKLGIAHIESGVIFRDNIKSGTPLGKEAELYIKRGELVPDEITIPMILDRLKKQDCSNGWLLDGFPRNVKQAEALHRALAESSMKLDAVIEIVLSREISKNRIMGRRICKSDASHPNNVFIDAIKPVEKDGSLQCSVCGSELITRDDDQDEAAINKRHDIYYNETTGTLAAAAYFRDRSGSEGFRVITVDGRPGVRDVTASLMSQLSSDELS